MLPTLAGLIVAVCLSLLGQTTNRAEAPRPAPAKERDLVDVALGLARSSPPEFAADGLILLVERGHISSPRDSKQALEDAYAAGGAAQEPIALRQVRPNNTLTVALIWAFQRELDSLALRLRAARLMLRFDRKRARLMVQGIALPNLPARLCEDDSAYDFRPFYKALAVFFEQSFTEAERAAGAPAEVLAPLIALVSTAQIAPAAELLLRLDLPADTRDTLIGRLLAETRQVPEDWRTFSASANEIAAAFRNLSEIPHWREPVLAAAREFYVAHSLGKRCADPPLTRYDNVNGSTTFVWKPVDPRALFNDVLWPRAAPGSLRPIPEEETTAPGEIGAAPRPLQLWQSKEARQLQRWLSLLRRSAAADSELSEWQGQAERFLNQVIEWDGSTEASTEVFYLQKCDLYSGFANMPAAKPPPLGPTKSEMRAYVEALKSRPVLLAREKALKSLCEFFSGPAAMQTLQRRRLIWYRPVMIFFQDIDHLYPDNAAAVPAYLVNSRNVAMQLYAVLHQLKQAASSPGRPAGSANKR